jgi:S-sulfo-L-cysteine synthase (O-acetyl-L-serine-dependent)
MATALLDRATLFSPHSVLGQIGNTPLVHFPRLSSLTPGIEIYGKDESRNPGGSVKDRPALNMILQGEREGRLTRQKVIIDATSGNTGIAYAMIGAALGYRVKLCLPQNASHERKRILQAYGAEVVYTPGGEGSDGAIRRVREIVAQEPDAYYYPDQYSNPANWLAHYETTAVEILQQTDRAVTHFVAGVGTSGTCMGVTRRFREEAPYVRCYSMQPDAAFHGLEGLKHMASAMVPEIYDPQLPDGNIDVSTEEAHRMVRRIARQEGLLIGVSAGGNLAAAHRLARKLHADGERAVIVTILCDGAAKYLSEHFWDDPD